MEESEQIQTKQMVNFEDYAMSVEHVQSQVRLIQQVMQNVMRENEHYGVIPGCGSKPSLLKPGAEKISTTFRLAPYYEIKKTDTINGHREYEIVCTLKHIPTGQIVSQGVGSCSTMEAKYRYRKAEQKCPKCGKTTIIRGKKEYGGGWLCWKKNGGCGEKFKDGDTQIENQEMGRVEHDNPADYYNTVLKMGKKRAHVDAVLTATAASDIFTQDIEDMQDLFNGKQEKKSRPKEKKKKKQPARERLMELMRNEELSKEDMKSVFKFAFPDDESSADVPEEELERAIKHFDEIVDAWRTQ